MFINNRYGGHSAKSGFTLIELLVVIAIIGILSSVVLASLNSARKKGRDARRVADIKQLQLALELYYDANGQYPTTLGSTSSSPLVTAGYIAALPTDPTDGDVYGYVAYAATASPATCNGYHVGASLETTGHSSLSADSDITTFPALTGQCTGGAAADINGLDSAKCLATDAGVACYDVRG